MKIREDLKSFLRMVVLPVIIVGIAEATVILCLMAIIPPKGCP